MTDIVLAFICGLCIGGTLTIAVCLIVAVASDEDY